MAPCALVHVVWHHRTAVGHMVSPSTMDRVILCYLLLADADLNPHFAENKASKTETTNQTNQL